MVLKYCPKCGKELGPNDSYCNYCGADLRERMINEPIEPPKTIVTTPQPPTSSTMPETVSEAEKELASKEMYADFLPRLAALLIDGIIIFVITLILNAFLNAPFFVYNLIALVIALLYLWLLEAFNNGQTLGKMALKLRTVNEKTLEVATAGDYLVNNLLKCHIILLIIDFIIGILSNSGDPQNRLRIMQNASSTVVIKIKG